ncbi:MAG TPA: sigma-70 family RNA polymerase sigma factor [Planctomycetota bacterium]|nr:sigma-70 family RNA polymerase sigma factor [Planctomycetota bacterium]
MDRDAFARLVRLHQPAVSRFAGRYLRSAEDRDDVVQESFLRAWSQIDRFKPGTSFVAWVLAIARFLCMARMQDARRHPPAAPLQDVADSSGDLGEDLERLRKACASLPLPMREVVALRFFDGFDYRTIAQITGDSEVALRSRLHDALERLRTVLAKP